MYRGAQQKKETLQSSTWDKSLWGASLGKKLNVPYFLRYNKTGYVTNSTNSDLKFAEWYS
jgi:hypothetical protein